MREPHITLIGIFFAVILASCGSTTDRQTRTVETTRTTTQPITIDSPFGQFVVQPTQATVQRTQQEVETTTKTIDMPDVGGAMMVAASGTPWGGIISGVIGLGTAAFAAKKAVDNGRQRDNLIDATEAAKEEMDEETWKRVRKTMNNVQHDDTIAAVKKRTA